MWERIKQDRKQKRKEQSNENRKTTRISERKKINREEGNQETLTGKNREKIKTGKREKADEKANLLKSVDIVHSLHEYHVGHCIGYISYTRRFGN
jgi:hypothetical protein